MVYTVSRCPHFKDVLIEGLDCMSTHTHFSQVYTYMEIHVHSKLAKEYKYKGRRVIPTQTKQKHTHVHHTQDIKNLNILLEHMQPQGLENTISIYSTI